MERGGIGLDLPCLAIISGERGLRVLTSKVDGSGCSFCQKVSEWTM